MEDNVNDMLNVRNDATPTGSSGDFWTFGTMITPVLIQMIFYIGVIACVVVGGSIIAEAYGELPNRSFSSIYKYSYLWNQVLIGLALVLLGPLVVRISCEFLILFFRMDETLTEIKNKLR